MVFSPFFKYLEYILEIKYTKHVENTLNTYWNCDWSNKCFFGQIYKRCQLPLSLSVSHTHIVFRSLCLPNSFSCSAESAVFVYKLLHLISTWNQSARVENPLQPTSASNTDKLLISGQEKTRTWTEVWATRFRQKSSIGATTHLVHTRCIVPAWTRVLELCRRSKRSTTRADTQRLPRVVASYKLSLLLRRLVCPRLDAWVHKGCKVTEACLGELEESLRRQHHNP